MADKLVHLVGIDHKDTQIEWDESCASAIEQYKKYLYDLIGGRSIYLIAEESNNQFIDNCRSMPGFESGKTVAGEFADTHKIKYFAIDPDEGERKKRGILDDSEIEAEVIRLKTPSVTFRDLKKKQNQKREQIWVEKLRPYINKEIIFICGSNHLESFPKLLSKDGFMVEGAMPKFHSAEVN